MMILMESMNQWGISWEYPWGFERKKMGMSVISHFFCLKQKWEYSIRNIRENH